MNHDLKFRRAHKYKRKYYNPKFLWRNMFSYLFLCQYPAATRRTISSIYSKTNDGLNRQMSTLKLFSISKCIQHPGRVVPLGGRVKY